MPALACSGFQFINVVVLNFNFIFQFLSGKVNSTFYTTEWKVKLLRNLMVFETFIIHLEWLPKGLRQHIDDFKRLFHEHGHFTFIENIFLPTVDVIQSTGLIRNGIISFSSS